jgi:ABC-type Fe3+-hydroxamate transport system substrate-binding protein
VSPLRADRLALVWLLSIALEGCGSAGESERSASPSSEPPSHRIVTLSPPATDFALAIGAGHELVAIDAASARELSLRDIPIVDWASASSAEPDVVLAPAPLNLEDPIARALHAGGAKLSEYAPHNLEDAFALCRSIGAELVGAERAEQYLMSLGRPLALVGGSSFGFSRPRVLPIASLDPLALAGGHSFETDLIEIAGGASLTHGSSDLRVEIGFEELARYAADLVVVFTREALSEEAQRTARRSLRDDVPVEFFAVDTEHFWLREPERVAARLREGIEALSQPVEARARKP